MADLLSIPAEVRLQIYEALIIPEPRCIRIKPAESGPVLCYTHHSFDAAIVGVNRMIRKEAEHSLYKANPCMFYIYLVFNGDEACGSDLYGGLAAALETFSKSKHFHQVHACIIDIRLFCGKSKYTIPHFTTFEVLRNSVDAICETVSQSPVLEQVEISWCDYFTKSLGAHQRQSLQPLRKVPAQIKAHVRAVEKTRERSEADFSDWPNMLKPYRRLGFGYSCFEEDEYDDVESEVFQPPHPCSLDVFGAEPDWQDAAND